jgi:hypothetical protein
MTVEVPRGRPGQETTSTDSAEASLTPDHERIAELRQYTLRLELEPQHDPFCGRCGGPSGPEGAWCNNCIRECREYTRWLDSQQEAA